MNYKVYECEDKVTTTGKGLKKLVLQGDGKQYPDKNVTMWSDHPLFSTVAVGQTIDVELDIKDSTTPNPKGGFYKNKTVIKGNITKSMAKPEGDKFNASAAEIKNILMFKVMPVLDRLSYFMDKKEGKSPEAIDEAMNNGGDITPDDLPF